MGRFNRSGLRDCLSSALRGAGSALGLLLSDGEAAVARVELGSSAYHRAIALQHRFTATIQAKRARELESAFRSA